MIYYRGKDHGSDMPSKIGEVLRSGDFNGIGSTQGLATRWATTISSSMLQKNIQQRSYMHLIASIANGTEGWRSRSAEVEVLARDSESGSDAF